MKPDTPPITNTKMKPAKNRNGVENAGRPVEMVPSQEKMEIALGTAMMIDTALKKDSAIGGKPVANIWCSHTPNPSTTVSTVANATAV